MSQHYFNPKRESDPYSLPDCEVFHVGPSDVDDFETEDGEPMSPGWYYWACFPGCLPDSDPIGPFETERDAIEDAQSAFDYGED